MLFKHKEYPGVLVRIKPGKTVRFSGHMLETTDADTQKKLKGMESVERVDEAKPRSTGG